MIKDKEAIETAVRYLQDLSKMQGGIVEEQVPGTVRLETIQMFDKEWVIVLSYMPKVSAKSGKKKPEWWEMLENTRRFREVTIAGDSGQVTSLRDPRTLA